MFLCLFLPFVVCNVSFHTQLGLFGCFLSKYMIIKPLSSFIDFVNISSKYDDEFSVKVLCVRVVS